MTGMQLLTVFAEEDEAMISQAQDGKPQLHLNVVKDTLECGF